MPIFDMGFTDLFDSCLLAFWLCGIFIEELRNVLSSCLFRLWKKLRRIFLL